MSAWASKPEFTHNVTKVTAIMTSYMQKMKPNTPTIVSITTKQHAVGTNAIQENELIIVIVDCYYQAA